MKTILVDAVHTFIIPDEGIFKEMHELLETYQHQKIILTGANDEQMKLFGLNDMPYEVFTLKHDPEKINPNYFKTMLDKFNLKVEDVVYFEHDEEAIKSAKSIGVMTYHYDKEGRDLVALKEFLDSNLQDT